MPAYKAVPALIKVVNILELIALSQRPRSLAEITSRLGYNRSTVFNLVHTLTEQGLLERGPGGSFRLGPRLYVLAQAGGAGPDLIRLARPVLEYVNHRTRLTTLLGSLYGDRVVIVDLVDSPQDVRISSQVGMRLPMFAGAAALAILSQMSDQEVDAVLDARPLERYNRFSILDKKRYRKMIVQARQDGAAVDRETYLEGVRGVAVPLRLSEGNPLSALWVIGLNQHIRDEDIPGYIELLKDSAHQIEIGLSFNNMARPKTEGGAGRSMQG